jgi:hypothetical protein
MSSTFRAFKRRNSTDRVRAAELSSVHVASLNAGFDGFHTTPNRFRCGKSP